MSTERTEIVETDLAEYGATIRASVLKNERDQWKDRAEHAEAALATAREALECIVAGWNDSEFGSDNIGAFNLALAALSRLDEEAK